MHKEIGQKINELRTSRNMTLKDLSKKANLSVSFLSQAERGLTSIAIMSLKNIADALNVDLTYFFTLPQVHKKMILHSFEQEVFRIEDSKFIYYNLGSNIEGKRLDPMVITILPGQTAEEIIPYSHEGEEFIYVLEGIFTIFIDDSKYELYPGDSSHISSSIPHNWANLTNKLVRILAVNSPSVL